jgi:hypothetical protein
MRSITNRSELSDHDGNVCLAKVLASLARNELNSWPNCQRKDHRSDSHGATRVAELMDNNFVASSRQEITPAIHA